MGIFDSVIRQKLQLADHGKLRSLFVHHCHELRSEQINNIYYHCEKNGYVNLKFKCNIHTLILSSNVIYIRQRYRGSPFEGLTKWDYAAVLGCRAASRMNQFSFCGLCKSLGGERLQVPLRLEGPDVKKLS